MEKAKAIELAREAMRSMREWETVEQQIQPSIAMIESSPMGSVMEMDVTAAEQVTFMERYAGVKKTDELAARTERYCLLAIAGLFASGVLTEED